MQTVTLTLSFDLVTSSERCRRKMADKQRGDDRRVV